MEVEKIVKEESKKISGVKRKEKSETEGGLSMRRRGRSSTVGEHLWRTTPPESFEAKTCRSTGLDKVGRKMDEIDLLALEYPRSREIAPLWEGDWGREWVRLLVPPATPCKGESGKLGGRRIGGDYREGLAHLEANAGDGAYWQQ